MNLQQEQQKKNKSFINFSCQNKSFIKLNCQRYGIIQEIRASGDIKHPVRQLGGKSLVYSLFGCKNQPKALVLNAEYKNTSRRPQQCYKKFHQKN